MNELATLSPDMQELLGKAMTLLEASEESLARHRAAVATLRQELARMGRPMTALIGWGDDERSDDLIEIRLDLDEHGHAELGSSLDRLFDLSLAQALNRIGSLVLTRPASLSVAGSARRTQVCGIELDHGVWRYADQDADSRSPRWELL